MTFINLALSVVMSKSQCRAVAYLWPLYRFNRIVRRLSHGDASDTVKTSNQTFSGEDG